MPTSPLNGLYAHVCIWQPRRLMAPYYTPQPDIYKPFWHPHIQAKGCHMDRDGYLQGSGDNQGRGPLCQSTFLSLESRGFRFDSFRLLRGQLGYSGSRGMMTSFMWGWGREHGGMWYSSHQEPVQTLYLWSCNSQLYFLQSLCLQP